MSKRLIFLFSISLLLALKVAAKPAGIGGRVIDASGQPVSLASVLLLSATDSSLVSSTLTDQKGEYDLTPSPAGSYLLRVSYIGYNDNISEPFLCDGHAVIRPDVILSSSGKALAEVSVRASKPFVEVHADKLVVNVENSIVNAGSNALEVLTRSPGVYVDNNDNILFKGRPGVTIMINGKIQPLSGQELAEMLRNLPANSVEAIELISNPSARYDAAGSAGIINIRLKRNKKKGVNGSVNAAYAQGVYRKMNGGFNLNYRNKKVSLFANYNHSDRQGFNDLKLDRNFFNGNTFAGAFIQDNQYLYNVLSDNGSLGLDYSLSSRTTVGIAATGETTSFKRTGYNYSRIIDSATGQQLSHFVTENAAPNIWSGRSVNLNLRHKFDSAGRSLSVDADYAGYPGSGTQDYTTNYYNDLPDGSSVLSGRLPAVFRGDLTGLTQIRSLKADYATPLFKGAKMELGAKTSYVTSDHDLAFFNYRSATWITDSQRTNNFKYREHILAAYANGNMDREKWSAQVGLRWEQTIASGDAVSPAKDSSFTRRYGQLFPSFSVQRHLTSTHDIGLSLSRRIERPNYDQLNPSTYYLDPTTYKAGDPYLNPALSYNAELSHVFRQRLVTTLSYAYTSSPIVEVIQPSATESRVTVQTQKNLSGLSWYGGSGAYQFRFAKWWSNTTNCNVYYAHYNGNIAGTPLSKGRVSFDINTSNSFILPNDWSAELGGNYHAPQQYGYMVDKPTWMVNCGVQKNLFDKKATIRLNATDLFWRGYPRATSEYTGYKESFVARRDTRQVALSVTWRFGTRSQSQQRSGGAEDEKRRVGQGA
ncbi:MAG: TonB-dependent receptor [Flavipsychrobacter sp.]|nr:TonB-dependent receptor [Flavipsychrobacter sp.]